jgi:type VI secretion system protein ImpM
VATVGFFGKVPLRGDFVRRALPASFITPWDHWLQTGIAGSQKMLGDDWLGVYLTSPAWRFALSPHVAGDMAVAGTFIPSVDRVGRYFPFTLACLLEGESAPVAIRGHTAWFDDAEALARKALTEDACFDDLVSGVEHLGCPTLTPPLPSDREGIRFDGLDDGPVHRLVESFAPPHGLFWTTGSKLVQPTHLLVWQLPSPTRFTALLDGAWVRHGWTEAAP